LAVLDAATTISATYSAEGQPALAY
jgi:hypothetical protein